MLDITSFYNSNKDFKRYVDLYCRKTGITVDEALEHTLVKDVANYYANAHHTGIDAIGKEVMDKMIFSEDKSC